MNSHHSEGIAAKLERADEHLKALTDEIAAFFEDKRDLYRLDPDYDAGRYGLRVAIQGPPPARLGTICGDYVHCLRSALDHLVCGVVPKVTRRTAFPIYRDRDEFLCGVTIPARRGQRGPLTGLDPTGAVFGWFEQVQPYNGRHGVENHPLWLLAELSNADKHRTILTRAVAHGANPDLQFFGEDIEYVGKAKFTYDKALEDGEEFLSGHFKVTGPKPQVQVYGRLPVDIAFGDIRLPSKGLDDIRKSVVAVIFRAFEKLGEKFP